MLHHTGNLRLPVEGGNGSTVEILAVRDHSKLSLLTFNHNVPGGETSDEHVSIVLKNISPDTPVTIARIDPDNANPKKKWIELGSPEYPAPSELAEMEQASRVVSRELGCEITKEGITLNFLLPQHGIALITLNIIG